MRERDGSGRDVEIGDGAVEDCGDGGGLVERDWWWELVREGAGFFFNSGGEREGGMGRHTCVTGLKDAREGERTVLADQAAGVGGVCHEVCIAALRKGGRVGVFGA